MIRIGKYAIKADENCYSLHEIKVAETETKAHKIGEEYTVQLNFYAGTVAHCVKAIIKRMQLEAVAQGADMGLVDAYAMFCEIENRVHDWAKGAGAE